MEMECDLVVDWFNESLPFEREWEVEKHLAICWERQELVELMSEHSYLVNARIFSSDMKARILARVFEEEPNSVTGKKSIHKRILHLPFFFVPFFTVLLCIVKTESTFICRKRQKLAEITARKNREWRYKR